MTAIRVNRRKLLAIHSLCVAPAILPARAVTSGMVSIARPLREWTDADFDRLSWHDNHVHGIHVEMANADHTTGILTLDLDHIIEWLSPRTTESLFGFA
jgi:hypothetical protein